MRTVQRYLLGLFDAGLEPAPHLAVYYTTRASDEVVEGAKNKKKHKKKIRKGGNDDDDDDDDDGASLQTLEVVEKAKRFDPNEGMPPR